MAELASGAVSSLLGLLQKEARLLGGVGKDVEFIREEMESMNSFLEHLSMTAHLTSGYNKQVRTWMKQVRDLAHDCSNCIDKYLQSGDLVVHRARGGLRRHVWWTYWLVQKMVTQQRAAMRLRELKDRVSDVGKRRMRYGVEIPGKAARGSAPTAAQTLPSSTPSRSAAEDEDDDDDDIQAQEAAIAGGSDPRLRALEHCTLEDFCAEKLVNWANSSRAQKSRRQGRWSIPSIAIVALDADTSATAAQGALDFAANHFQKCVSINLKALHYAWDLPLLPWEILSYILRECKKQDTGQGKMEEENDSEAAEAFDETINTFVEIRNQFDKIITPGRSEELRSRIGEVVHRMMAQVRSKKTEETKRPKASTGILGKRSNMMGRSSEQIIKDAATNLKHHMETVVPELPVRLDDFQYQDILQKVFLDSKSPQAAQESRNNTSGTLSDDHIKEILNNHKIALDSHKMALDIIQELLSRHQLLGGNSPKEQAKGFLQGSHDHTTATDAAITETEAMEENSGESKANSEETREKVEEIFQRILDSLLIERIVNKIKLLLESKRTLIILIDDGDYISQWEGIRDTLSLLAWTNDNAVVVITKNSVKAKEFCCAAGQPINYSLVGLYHDIVLQITSQRENGSGINNSQILCDILGRCDPNEFSMRMFAHALYANPNRSDEELQRLHGALQVAKNSVTANATIAKEMLKFSYRDLPREHKTCLLYLAIFPQAHKIRRSTLIERWAIEGLIVKEDWPTVVRHAEICFEALIGRYLVKPVLFSAAGKVKICMVDGQVHEFITKIANKEHILDARLSQPRARHFSTFSGLRLRASDSIDTVVQKLPRYLNKLRLLKLLDLEGCHCLDKKHIKDICSNILQLKYLSLRGTPVGDLPSEINNLHELEVLDIRQTKVPERATRGIVLLKLRRLLAGPMDSGTITMDCNPLNRAAVQIPHKIDKMDNLEVLSNVKAYTKDGAELKEIRKLGHLRKLGVVINNKKAHLKNLLWAISDLKECLQSLSITVLKTRNDVTSPDNNLLPCDLYMHLINPPKVLKSLSLDGSTNIVRLLTLFAKGSDELEKVTLSRTLLLKSNLIHITILPKLHCVRLRHDAYTEKALTLEKHEFPHLKNFLIECLHKTDIISFQNGAAPELEKIVIFSTDIKYLRGVGALPKLKELELKGNKLLVLSPGDGTASAEPIIPEDGRVSTKLSEDGISSAEKIIPKDGIVSAEPILPEDGIASAETITPEGGTASADPTTESTLIFKKDEFQHLKYFLVEGPIMQTNIKFEGGAPELEKIVLSGTNIESVAGVSGLAKLREIDLKGDRTLLSFFATANHIAKVTLSDTNLKLDDLKIALAKKPKLCSLVLLNNSYDDERQLTFDKHEFPMLKVLIVDCLKISSINFAEESACKIEKIVWSFTKLESLSGIHNLQELKELEVTGGSIPLQVRKDIGSAHNVKLIHNKQPLEDKRKEGLPL